MAGKEPLETHSTEDSEQSTQDGIEEYEAVEVGNGNRKRPGLYQVKSYASGAEGYDNDRGDGLLSRQHTTATQASAATLHHPDFEVDWEEDDPGNPKLWPMWKKASIIAAMSYGTSSV